ncbi:MAG: adenylate kinase [Candidatus Bathyarchaeota archaeon]|nr:adenylate kinase [Candidatus Bathyarchaeota archaeon]
MRIVLLGPPGSGKGTCAKFIEDLYGVPVITTGNMLRAAVHNDTPLGKTAKGYMDRGELVPDDLVNILVTERLSEPDAANGFILDGYPRSAKQADALDESLKKMGKRLDHVLQVNLEDDVIINRTSNRRSCPKCGSIFNLLNKPPKVADKCDVCGETLLQRDDDKEDVIINRLKVYHENTRPLLYWYEKKGKVKSIRGDIGLTELPTALKRLLED